MLFALLLGVLAALVFAGVALAADVNTPTKDADKIIGTNDADNIAALEGNDRVWAIGGGAGTDADGKPVYDVVSGGGGSDTLYGDADPSKALKEDGTLVFTKTGLKNRSFTGAGIPGQDELRGNQGNDLLYGNEENDKLIGGMGSDVLYGEDGNDILNAGTEETPRPDELTGGRNQDEFWVDHDSFVAYQNGLTPPDTGDVIKDPEPGEVVKDLGGTGAEFTFTATS
jgi:Ca2+-binding RTX toxin-like protein